MKQIQPFQKHWLQITSIVVCRLNYPADKQILFINVTAVTLGQGHQKVI